MAEVAALTAKLRETFPELDVSAIDEKGHIASTQRDSILRKCRLENANRTCFECGARGPVWCSVSFGVYLCLDCSGNHRRKGVHISFVRSVDMDKFYPDQLVQMAIGGNGKALNYFKEVGMGRTSSTGRAVDFTSKTAVKYKDDLSARAKAVAVALGAAERTDEPEETTGTTGATSATSTPAPAAPEVTWVAGQRIQYRDAGNPTWKWGEVTHCKPLKVDYSVRNEVRMNPSGKVFNIDAQKDIAFAAAAAAKAAASQPKAAPAPAPAAATPAAPVARKAEPAIAPAAPKPASNMVIRGCNGAVTASAPTGGYSAAAEPKKMQAQEIDLGDIFGDPTKPKASSPKACPQQAPAAAPAEVIAANVVSPAPAAKAPAPAAKKNNDADEFDWDF